MRWARWPTATSDFRRSIPLGFLNDAQAMSALAVQFDEFKQVFQQGSALQDAVHKHVEHLVVQNPPLPDGHFAVLFEEIDLDTRLKKRRIALSRLFDEGAQTGLQFSGNNIIGPAKIKPALEFIQAVPTFTPADLPGGLSDREKLVLARRLIAIGLLTLD